MSPSQGGTGCVSSVVLERDPETRRQNPSTLDSGRSARGVSGTYKDPTSHPRIFACLAYERALATLFLRARPVGASERDPWKAVLSIVPVRDGLSRGWTLSGSEDEPLQSEGRAESLWVSNSLKRSSGSRRGWGPPLPAKSVKATGTAGRSPLKATGFRVSLGSPQGTLPVRVEGGGGGGDPGSTLLPAGHGGVGGRQTAEASVSLKPSL